MKYQVVPDSEQIGPIPCKTLRYAIGYKACLFAKLDMESTILDEDDFVVSRKEQSEYIFKMFC